MREKKINKDEEKEKDSVRIEVIRLQETKGLRRNKEKSVN